MQGYPELGEAAFGVAGRRLVTVATIELFGGSCMMLIILWRSLQACTYLAHVPRMALNACGASPDTEARHLLAVPVLFKRQPCLWGTCVYVCTTALGWIDSGFPAFPGEKLSLIHI